MAKAYSEVRTFHHLSRLSLAFYLSYMKFRKRCIIMNAIGGYTYILCDTFKFSVIINETMDNVAIYAVY